MKTNETRDPIRSRGASAIKSQTAHADIDTLLAGGIEREGSSQTRSTRQQLPKRIPALTTSRTFGSKTPIIEADFQAFLARCMGQWPGYSESEKAAIIASLPLSRQIQSIEEAPLSTEFCRNDKYLKNGIARFKRDLQDGYYEKSWQDRASKAHEARMEGKFDDFIREHNEEMFKHDEADIDNSMDELAEESEDGEYVDGGGSKGKIAKAQKPI